MLQTIEQLTGQFVGLVWGVPLVLVLVGSGIFFTIYFGFPQLRFFKHAIDIVFGKYDKPEDKGEISHFQALTAALSATVGLGNIAGVAIAIAAGGPGAVFWLWVAGFIGMCTKFTEVTLAVKYRNITPEGHTHGGPMFVLKNALNTPFFNSLAWIYAFFVILSSFGAGNMFQSNQMASILNSTMGTPTWVSGAIFCFFAFLILVGGIKRIGKVTEKMVPIMVGIYLVGAVVILAKNLGIIPSMFAQIFTDAFTGTAAFGGFAGVAVKEVIIMGIRRATFSNEAGMGSSAMAHSAAKSSPIQEGIVALLEPFIDTIVVCSITALALLATGVWANGTATGSELTAQAFEMVMGSSGRWIVTATVTLFAFSTIISWSYYGEQGVTYIFGEKWIPVYRYIFIGFIFVGAVAQLNIVLNLSDAVYGLLAVPNMIACYMLLPKVKAELTEYTAKLKSGEIKPHK
jgi:AGCS family alanine or glycine:cation symporter